MKAGGNNAFLGSYSNDITQANLTLAKSRHATLGSHTIVQDGDALGELNFKGSDGTNFEFGAAIAASVDGTPGNNDMPTRLAFFTTPDGSVSPLERIRIDKDGRVGINVTPDGASRLQVQSANATDAQIALLTDTDTSVTSANVILALQFSGDNDCTAGRFVQFYDQGGVIGSITAASATTVAFNTSSDARLKEQVKDFDGTALVKMLRPVTFLWKEKSSKYQEKANYGFIAQEVHQVLPTIVSVGSEDDSGIDARQAPWSMDYGKLTGVLTKALQEALLRIEALEKKVN